MDRKEYKKELVRELQLEILDVGVFINKIFDDLESRTCENCEQADKEPYNDSDKLWWCRKHNMCVINNLSCNLFSNKA